MMRLLKKGIAVLLIAELLLAPMGVCARDGGVALGQSGPTSRQISPRMINDRYTVGDLVYKEIGPGAVQVIAHVDADQASGAVTIPPSITVTVNGAAKIFAVTDIGTAAFADSVGLSSVAIPDSVTVIGSNAFAGCDGLTGVAIPRAVTDIGTGAFAGCIGLTAISIPDSVTAVEDFVFSGCTGLASVVLPDTVTAIGDYAFSGCASLNSVTIPRTVTAIGDYAFSGCFGLSGVTIPDAVTAIGIFAFADCTGLTAVTIPRSVTTIGQYVFNGCFSLGAGSITAADAAVAQLLVDSGVADTQIQIVGGGTVAPPQSFAVGGFAYRVSDAANRRVILVGAAPVSGAVSIPSTITYNSQSYAVTAIGPNAFSTQSGMTSAHIPDSVTTIGNHAFFACKELVSVTLPDSVTSIGANAFALCEKLASVTLPKSISAIAKETFNNCYALASVTIPSSVTDIGAGAFWYCTALTGITIPETVTGIGESAFGASGLTSVTIPGRLDYLGGDAFSKNVALHCAYPETQLLVNRVLHMDALPTSGWNGQGDIPPGAVVTVDRNITIAGNVAIGKGAQVVVPDGVTIAVGAGATLTVDPDAVLTGPGGIVVKSGGTLVGSTGTIPVTYERISSGGRSSSGGSGSSERTSAAPAKRTITAAAMKSLIAAADSDIVRVSSPVSTTVEKGAWKLLAGYRFVARTSEENAVQVQLTFARPDKVERDLAVSGRVKGIDVERGERIFEKWFENQVRVIHLEHPGLFGQPVDIAARVDLRGMDIEELVLYSYSRESNSYRRIAEPNIRVDGNGYLHFTAQAGGDIVISEGALTRE